MTEGRGERATGTPTTLYDLSSVLFHALEGGASYDQYIRDAEEVGDEELATFFIEVRDEDSMRAEEAQRLLAERTSTTDRAGGTSTSMAEGAAAGLSSGMQPTGPILGAEEELPPTREAGPPRTEPVSAAPGEGDVPPRRTEEVPPPRPELSDDLPGTEPIAEGAPSGDVRREAPITRTTEEEDLTPLGAEIRPDVPRTGEVPPGRAADETPPPPRTAGIEEGVLPRTEEAPPSRTEEAPVAEEVPSGTPPQAPPGDVQSGTSPEPRPETDEGRPGQEEREEDKGLIEKARDYLRGEDRERDYLSGEDRERRER